MRSIAVSLIAVFVLVCNAPSALAQSIVDDFNRPDGVVGNGWSTSGGGATILAGELVTFGLGGQGGHISRTFPITFPVTFSFDFRTASPIDGGWTLEFNDNDPNVFSGGELSLFHVRGSLPLIFYYRPAGGEPNGLFGTVVSGQAQDYGLAPAHVSGTVQADLSSTVTITYADNTQVVLATPPPVDALIVPQGTFFTLGNGNATFGPHYFDNLVVGPPPQSPAQQIANLIQLTVVMNFASNIQSQLDAKLDAALGTLDAAKKNSAPTAANQLQAFVNAVGADVRGTKLTCADATTQVNAAQAIVSGLEQPPLSVSLPCQ